MKEFTPSDKLPDYKSVVGVVRYSLEKKGKGVTTVDMAARAVSKQIQAKWFHDTVYYVSLSSVCKMVRKVHTTYTEGKHRQNQGRLNS